MAQSETFYGSTDWTVPSGIKGDISIQMDGGGGQNDETGNGIGAAGGSVNLDLTASAGEVLYIDELFGGGGGYPPGTAFYGGDGGHGMRIRYPTNSSSDDIAAVGGGGGGGGAGGGDGGQGGGPNDYGFDGTTLNNYDSVAGDGGTTSSGGAGGTAPNTAQDGGDGSYGRGGNGGDGDGSDGSGGGGAGGGYYGGGGSAGGTGTNDGETGGGGGGSGYVNTGLTAVSNVSGSRGGGFSGNGTRSGRVILTYEIEPDTPTNVSAVSNTTTSIDLTWDDAAAADTYNVYRSTSPGVTTSDTLVGEPSSSSFTDSGLTTGQTYYYAIESEASGGSVSPSLSSEVSATPGATVNVGTGTGVEDGIVKVYDGTNWVHVSDVKTYDGTDWT